MTSLEKLESCRRTVAAQWTTAIRCFVCDPTVLQYEIYDDKQAQKHQVSMMRVCEKARVGYRLTDVVTAAKLTPGANR